MDFNFVESIILFICYILQIVRSCDYGDEVKLTTTKH
jgi:hypothetical protein